ncbi:MAG: regulator [Bacteroidetes bacterium]|nr:MAG: regulator [Bacteroidota bacterium]
MLPKVAIVEDNEMYASILEQALKEKGYPVVVFHSGRDFLNRIHDDFSILSLDHGLEGMSGMEVLRQVHKLRPKLPVIFLSGQDDVNVVVEAYDNGALRYIVKNDQSILKMIHALKNISSYIALEEEVELLREEIPDRSKYRHIIGESSALLRVLKLIQRVEKSDTLVMITGSSGTGKELVAQAIHDNSPRRKKPFVAVNVAAIPDHLMEDELFGHERGAFTGASSRRKGRFEEAQGGTIFLDEIGELELKLQAKMLRVLQEKKISRLGSNKEIKLDLRIIAATNKNLGILVKQGLFREDLYYRIQGFLIHLPNLRERGSDVLILARHFLQLFADRHGAGDVRFDESAEKKLKEHEWYGNVRELMAVIDRCILMRDDQTITAKGLIFSDGI